MSEVLATVFYLGYSPVASGTVGSLPAIVAAYWLSPYPAGFSIAIILMFLLGTAASFRVERRLGRKDPGEVVIDEFVGMLVALFWLPLTWKTMVVAFILFRVFDILKPFPAKRLESLPGGFGIMVDDIVAAFYANLCMHLLLWLFGYGAA